MDITPTTFRRYFKVLLILTALSQLQACGGSSTASTAPVDTQLASYQITVTPGIGGDATPSTQSVSAGNAATISINPDPGYSIDSLSGCSGTLEDTVFTVESVIESCSLVIEFIRNIYDVNVTTNNGGNVESDSFQLEHGNILDVTIVPENDFYIASISGCEGVLEGFVYTTLPVEQACDIEITFQSREYIQGDLELSLDYGKDRVFYFSWMSESDWQEYRLYEDERGTSDFQEIAVANGDSHTFSLDVPLHLKTDARYKLEACSEKECTVSNVVQAYNHIVDTVETLTVPESVESCGEVSYSNEIAVSNDGRWMALHTNEILCSNSGYESVVVYHKQDHQWRYHSHFDMEFDYFKYDNFKNPMAFSGDGIRLAVGVVNPSGRTVYIYRILEGKWVIEDALETPWINDNSSRFQGLVFSDDGMTLAYTGGYDVYHPCFIMSPCPPGYAYSLEFISEGYIFIHKYRKGSWSKAAILKSNYRHREDWFGYSFDLSADGNRLVVGAPTENYDVSYPDKKIDSQEGVGSVYIYDYDEFWHLSKLVKPDLEKKEAHNQFGSHVSMSSSGNQFIVSVSARDLPGRNKFPSYAIHKPYFYSFEGDKWSEKGITEEHINFDKFVINNATLSGDGSMMAARVNGVNTCDGLLSNIPDPDSIYTGFQGVVVILQQENENWKYINCLNSPIQYTAANRYAEFLIDVDGIEYHNIGFGYKIYLSETGTSFVTQGGLSPWEVEYYDNDIYPVFIY